jgi:hypothetical protein
MNTFAERLTLLAAGIALALVAGTVLAPHF